MQRKIITLLILIVWPLSLYLNNTSSDFAKYIFPFIEPKFAILPLVFVLIFYKFNRPLLIIVSILILIIFFKSFFGQTIFTKDYEAGQLVIQKQHLYNSVILARIFQNKPRIILDKFTNNFFAIADPNNYFFGFAPRQITVDNQNLKKFPFLSLPFLIIGLLNLKKLKGYKLLLSFLVSSVFCLSLLKNFDRHDFILWIPLSLIIIHGLKIFSNSNFKFKKVYVLLFIICGSIETIRLFYY